MVPFRPRIEAGLRRLRDGINAARRSAARALRPAEDGVPVPLPFGGLPAYEPRVPSRSEFVSLRGLRHHLRVWGDPADRPLVMLHGARDGSATFQFLVDALSRSWYVLAPDLRGHALSDRAPGYAFPDYLADLDAFLERAFEGRPVPVLGHSLGGNIACIYGGVRPDRVSHVISLDGFGLPNRDPAQAPDHLEHWLDACANPPDARVYPGLADLVERVAQANPRLDRERAVFLAAHLGRAVPGGVAWAVDPLHRLPFATLHRSAEWAACVGRTTAPALWIGSDRPFPPGIEREPGGLARRVELARATFRRVPETGHNLHHDAPETVAALIEPFLRDGAA